MKKVWQIILIGLALAVFYNLFLFLVPIKRNAYYNNDERAEAYVFSKQKFDTVTVGSSLCGAFEGRSLFKKDYFNLFMPHTGSCTGVEIIMRRKKIPVELFLEINHIDRGIDTAVIKDVFGTPYYKYEYYLPVLQKKGKLLINLLDKTKPPVSTVNKVRPPAELYNKLLASAQKEWSDYPDKRSFDNQYDHLSASLDFIASKGCKIYFFEMPMDSSLRHSKLITYQRARMTMLARQKNYTFIPADTSRAYNTGDGIHLLQADRNIYVKYLRTAISASNKK